MENGEMRVDTHTKIVLTIIAVALLVIAGKQYMTPHSVKAAGQFGNLQFAESGG
jgi:hypothetical protein